MRKFIAAVFVSGVLVILLVALLVTGVIAGTDESDLDPPVLVELSIEPTYVDTSGGSQTITVTARMTDNLSGCSPIGYSCILVLLGPLNGPDTQRGEAQMGIRELISGSGTDGVYQKTFTIPQYSFEGRWVLDYYTVVDNVQNRCSWYRERETSDPFVHVIDPPYFVNVTDDEPTPTETPTPTPPATLTPTPSLTQAPTQDGNRVGLVVIHDDGTVVQQCISFIEPEISSLQVLERSGLDLNYEAGNALGAAICRIDAEGCSFPEEDCFCQCLEPPCKYWSYWYRSDGDWFYSSAGASNRRVRNGDMEAWVWSEGTLNTSADRRPPEDVVFDTVCLPPTATPTVTPTATETATSNAVFLPMVEK